MKILFNPLLPAVASTEIHYEEPNLFFLKLFLGRVFIPLFKNNWLHYQ